MNGAPTTPLDIAKMWLKLLAKGENLTTVCDEPVTMMDSETLRHFAQLALNAVAQAEKIKDIVK